MRADLIILGNNSAMPAHGRHPSAQILSYDGCLNLIDCGEGTQMQMTQYRIKRGRIKRIFISHMHGDHVFGLPGVITTYNHYHRTDDLTLYGPIGIRRYIEDIIAMTGNPLSYRLHIVEFDPSEVSVLYADDGLMVETIPLDHRIPTAGFLFSMKRRRLKIRPESFALYGVENDFKSAIQQGADFVTPSGEVIANQKFTFPAEPPLQYAYVSDTCYNPQLADRLNGIQLLYHEATFLHESVERAHETKHSTALEAALIAQAAGAKQLLIGHFSSKYRDLTPLIEEAKSVFPNTHLAEEGQHFAIQRTDLY